MGTRGERALAALEVGPIVERALPEAVLRGDYTICYDPAAIDLGAAVGDLLGAKCSLEKFVPEGDVWNMAGR